VAPAMLPRPRTNPRRCKVDCMGDIMQDAPGAQRKRICRQFRTQRPAPRPPDLEGTISIPCDPMARRQRAPSTSAAHASPTGRRDAGATSACDPFEIRRSGFRSRDVRSATTPRRPQPSASSSSARRPEFDRPSGTLESRRTRAIPSSPIGFRHKFSWVAQTTGKRTMSETKLVRDAGSRQPGGARS
jgi:hypothetical protein